MAIKKKILAVRMVRFVLAIILLVLSLLALTPFILMIITSLTDKENMDLIFTNTPFHGMNYVRIFTNLDMGRAFLNTTVITVATCILECVVSSMAAFAFAKKKFPGRDKIFLFYLATIMIPGQVTLIPYFVIIRKLHLMNTYAALFLPIGAFGVFMIRQFMLNLPDEMLEAGIIDGCNEPQLFVIIVIPLIKAVLVSLTIFTFISSWNDFIRPLLVMTRNEMQTLTVGLATLQGTYIRNYGLIMAGASIGFLPPFLLYLILQRQFVEGIALSGIKG